MLKAILIILIVIVIFKIYTTYNENNLRTKEEQLKSRENFDFNINNPFVDGLSQFQLGNNVPDQGSILDPDTLPTLSSNNVINAKQLENLEKKKLDNSSRINQNINLIDQMLKSKKKASKHKHSKSSNKLYIPCKKLNKFFVQSQWNDAYRDTMTAFNTLCPDQKSIFNLQVLPVTSTMYDLGSKTPPPFEFIKLTTQFINKLNEITMKLPESVEIVNNWNNYLPLTSQTAKYVQDKGINKFYKEIGVNYNLYADTPPNSPVELIQYTAMTREFTEAQTKYIVSFVIKKILKSVDDQLKITVHFVTKNDPEESVNMFGKHFEPSQKINSLQQVAIEYIFVDGFYTNEFDYDYDCAVQPSKRVSNIDGDDQYYSFDALGTSHLTSEHEIIKEYNKKLREHELEMNNFNINVPYPIYANEKKANDNPPIFPTSLY
jgi:uncharacterized protein (DUF1499 family)